LPDPQEVRSRCRRRDRQPRKRRPFCPDGCEPARGLVWRPTALRHDLGGFAATSNAAIRRLRHRFRVVQQQTLSVAYHWQLETRIVEALLAPVANALCPKLRMTAVG